MRKNEKERETERIRRGEKEIERAGKRDDVCACVFVCVRERERERV